MHRSCSILSAGLLALALWAGCGSDSDDGAPPAPPQDPWPLTHDCAEADPECPELFIVGDAAHTFPNGDPGNFRGFADPAIRQDPVSGTLWLAYSWPSVHIVGPGQVPPGVDIHLAYSVDGGETWFLQGELWPSRPDVDAGDGPTSGEAGYTDSEVANLLPVRNGDAVIWYGARLDYFVPNDGGFSRRPFDSFRVVVTQADSAPELATSPTATLGGKRTAAGWGVDTDLSALSPELQLYDMWNEPALYFESGTLYLVLRGLAFDPVTYKPRADLSDLLVFATTPAGDVRTWVWRYVGIMAGNTEAAELGGVGLTQVDIAKGKDGKLLAVLTPDDYDEDLQDFVHYGCRVVEMDSIEPPVFSRDESGGLRVRAIITAEDQMPLGPGASAYDPASATGILLTRRVKSPAYMEAWIHRTGISP